MTAAPLHIESFCLGQWMTNCFVVRAGGQACWIVDAGFEPQAMIGYVQQHRLEPRAVLLTHAHVDHIAGLAAVRQAWPDLPVLIHRDEQDFLTDPARNLSIMLEEPIVAPPATGSLAHGQMLELDERCFEVRHTPGHSPGGVTLYDAHGGEAIVGDTLFSGSIGRTDFPNADHGQLIRSIRQQLLTLPEATRILPGHGPKSTIGQERRNNPFL